MPNLDFITPKLKRYYDLFPADQIAIYTYDELRADISVVLQDMFCFLGVDPTFTPDTTVRHNVSATPKFPIIHNFLMKGNKVKSILRTLFPLSLREQVWTKLMAWNTAGAKPQLSEEDRKYLTQIYREEILKLQDLIQRDLSNWLDA